MSLAEQFGGPPYVTAWQGRRGWFRMCCFNGLSAAQQERLITYGNLPIDYLPEGVCPNPASVGVETEADRTGGPRFYCWDCAVAYLLNLRDGQR